MAFAVVALVAAVAFLVERVRAAGSSGAPAIRDSTPTGAVDA